MAERFCIPLLVLEQVARHAKAWNTAWYTEPNDVLHSRLADLRRALHAAGREPSSMRVTVGMWPQGMDDADTLAAALDKFRDLGIDDLIVSQGRKNPAALDVLRQAVDLSQIGG